MPKVIMMCGKICSGKSTHAEALRKANKAVVLSVDEGLAAKFNSIFEKPEPLEVDHDIKII